MKIPSHSKALHLAILACFCMLVPAQSAVLARYEFPGGSALVTTSLAGVTAANFAYTSTIDEGVIATADGGFSGGGNVFSRSDTTGSTQADALADDDFFSVTVSATNPGETLNLTSITFDYGLQNDNTSSFSGVVYLQSSVGGFGTGNPVIAGTGTTDTQNTAAITFALASFDLSGASFQGLASITFQFRFSDSANANGDLTRMDNVTINGSVVPEPSASIIGSLGALLLMRRRRI